MLDLITDPFAGQIARRALLEVVLIGPVAGPLGVWVVLYRQSYAAESISHGMLPGLVLAALVGIPLGVGAAIGLALAATVIALLSQAPGVSADTGVAVAVTTLFGAGSLMALSPEVPIGLGELLFGDPLAVRAGDLAAAGVLVLASGATLAAAHRSLLLTCFDPAAAAGLGGSNRLAGLLLLGLLAATTLIAVQALGSLLVVAIVVGPAAAALRVCERLSATLMVAAGLAVASGVAGLYLSHYLKIATGASIALAACAVFVVVLTVEEIRLVAAPRAATD